MVNIVPADEEELNEDPEDLEDLVRKTQISLQILDCFQKYFLLFCMSWLKPRCYNFMLLVSSSCCNKNSFCSYSDSLLNTMMKSISYWAIEKNSLAVLQFLNQMLKNM